MGEKFRREDVMDGAAQREANEPKIRDMSETRMRDFAEALETMHVDMDSKRVSSDDPSITQKAYRKDAARGLKAILAKAAADLAKAQAGDE